MFDSINKAWTAVKDNALAAGAKAYVNDKIAKFGTTTRLEIDSCSKTVVVEVLLKGENAPVSMSGSYEVVEKDGAKYVMLRDLRASREWVGAVLNHYVAARQFRIPEALSSLL